jgi:hypothetical protein
MADLPVWYKALMFMAFNTGYESATAGFSVIIRYFVLSPQCKQTVVVL